MRKAVPGIEVFGGISLDLTVGGVNPAAVEWMTKVEGGYGKVVWLPTFDSEAQVKLSGQAAVRAGDARRQDPARGARRHRARGAARPRAREGHSAPQESLLIIAEAKRQGVEHVLVTHAMNSPGGSMTLDEMREAARLGALLELVHSPLTDEQLRKEADAIKAIGAASFVLSSDLGQPRIRCTPTACSRSTRPHGAGRLRGGYRRHVAQEPGAAARPAARRLNSAAEPVRPSIEVQVIAMSGVVVGAKDAVEDSASAVADVV